jgi:hypothetical protein
VPLSGFEPRAVRSEVRSIYRLHYLGSKKKNVEKKTERSRENAKNEGERQREIVPKKMGTGERENFTFLSAPSK